MATYRIELVASDGATLLGCEDTDESISADSAEEAMDVFVRTGPYDRVIGEAFELHCYQMIVINRRDGSTEIYRAIPNQKVEKKSERKAQGL